MSAYVLRDVAIAVVYFLLANVVVMCTLLTGLPRPAGCCCCRAVLTHHPAGWYLVWRCILVKLSLVREVCGLDDVPKPAATKRRNHSRVRWLASSDMRSLARLTTRFGGRYWRQQQP